MKVQVVRAIQLLSAKQQKADSLCIKFSSTSYYKCAPGDSILYAKINTPIFCCPFPYKEHLNTLVRTKKMVTGVVYRQKDNKDNKTSLYTSIIIVFTKYLSQNMFSFQF